MVEIVVAEQHWVRWHDKYDDPESSLSRRLVAVQRRLQNALDQAEEGPIRLISLCAGQGRDVMGVLTEHPRRDDVIARLVELDAELVAEARQKATSAGLRTVEIVVGDASNTTAYEGAVPADVVLICGVFGNIGDSDLRNTVGALPQLCAPGAVVIWTRHRRHPDLTPSIRSWFVDAGFEDVAFDTEEGVAFGVGTNRFVGQPRPLELNRRMFSFVGDGSDAHF